MQYERLQKLTGWTSLGFGIYCLAMAFLVVFLELVAFSLIFAFIFMLIGIMYVIAGISMLRKGRYGIVVLFGFFGSTFWWSSGIDYYYWPMIIMPVVILAMMLALFVGRFVSMANE